MKNSKSLLLLVMIAFLATAINACSSIATNSPVPLTTDTPLPSATLTLTATPTSTLTATLTATFTSSPLPSATSALIPQDFYGTWRVWDAEAAGPDFLIFNEDGTFLAKHGINQGALLQKGKYKLSGNEVTFLDWWYCEPDQRMAVYLIRMYPDKLSVRFYPIDDPCAERVDDFTNRLLKWDKFIPTPTPTPSAGP
jgi:hypothetical protein